MKLNQYELEAERRYRFEERAGALYGTSKLTPDQVNEINTLIEPEMEALRNFEYD